MKLSSINLKFIFGILAISFVLFSFGNLQSFSISHTIVSNSFFPLDDLFSFFERLNFNSFFFGSEQVLGNVSLKCSSFLDKEICMNKTESVCSKVCKKDINESSKECSMKCNNVTKRVCTIKKVCNEKHDLNNKSSSEEHINKTSSKNKKEGSANFGQVVEDFSVVYDGKGFDFQGSCDEVLVWKGDLRAVLDSSKENSFLVEGYFVPEEDSLIRFGCLRKNNISTFSDIYYVKRVNVKKEGSLLSFDFDVEKPLEDLFSGVPSWAVIYKKEGEKWNYAYYDGNLKKWNRHGLGKYLEKGEYYFDHFGGEKSFLIVGKIKLVNKAK